MTSENPNGCYSMCNYFDFLKVLSSKNEPVKHLHCGSFFEIPVLYFLSNPTDIDIMYCDMTLCAIFDHVSVPPSRKRNVLRIDTTGCHVGYVRLRNGGEYFRKPYDFDKGPASIAQ